MMTKIGYTRVSTTDQNTDRQELGDIRVFEDKASGKSTERPALKEMLAYVLHIDHRWPSLRLLCLQPDA